MDNITTDSFIKALRKEKDMTQKQLAGRLHITDRAVSKWELTKYGCSNPDGWPEIEYQFLQWGTDSASMLIYYAFEDGAREAHTGYFWYNCETGAVDGIVEMDSR